MIKYLTSLFLYFYFLFFKRGVKTSFPCRVSPYFALKLPRFLKNVSLDKAFIGRSVKISEGCCFYEDPIVFGNVEIGRYTSINGPATRIFAKINKIKIGSFCSIASNVIIQEYNHNSKLLTTYDILPHVFNSKNECAYTSKGDIIIEDDVWIGSTVTILSGVHIGKGAIVGAGSVVVKDVPAYSIVVGNPAKIVKMRFSYQTINKLKELNWTDWSIDKIRENKNIFLQEFD